MKNSLTILICVHSTNDFYDMLLNKALVTLVNQTYKNFKTMIVLDECWGKTKEMIESSNYDLEITILSKDKKQGLANAKNYGISHVDTEWIGFLDGDDMYMPTKIEKQINYINNNNVDFLGTKAWYINNLDEETYLDLGSASFRETHEDIKNHIFNGNVLTHGSMMIKKTCLTELGGYHDVRGLEDWDLWKRGITNNFKFYQIPEQLYIYRMGTSVPS